MLIICSLFESDAGVGIPTPILRLFLATLVYSTVDSGLTITSPIKYGCPLTIEV